MTRNQLPDGVGKKIVEALKRQAEADITPIEEDNSIGNTIPLNENSIENLSISPINAEVDTVDNIIIEEEPNIILTQEINKPSQTTSTQQEASFDDLIQESTPPVIKETVRTVIEKPAPVVNERPKMNVKTEAPKFSDIPQQNLNFNINSSVNLQREQAVQSVYQVPGSIAIPANVATLRNLIAALPVGVTKQTGAQIIRQTLEAMGIPMNGVLKEAQEVQEELNSSTRECLLRIQEYKTNILQLEQSVQEYQKSINQINDLVSLFLLTDNK